MNKYINKPQPEDFLRWVEENKEFFTAFYWDYIFDLIVDLEQDDYFGTEGFDKRFS